MSILLRQLALTVESPENLDTSPMVVRVEDPVVSALADSLVKQLTSHTERERIRKAARRAKGGRKE